MSFGLLVSCMQPPRQTEPWSVAAAWWASQVICVTVAEVPQMGQESEHTRYYVLANGHGENILRVTRLSLRGPPEDALKDHWDRPIVAYTEMRQNFWAYQPESWITYHVSTILEVEVPGQQNLFILVERIDDRLEIMIGSGFIPRSFMLEFRATGRARRSDKCFQQPRKPVAPLVSVRRFFEWLGSSFAKGWQPYHILQSNCQHVAEEVQRFVVQPNDPVKDIHNIGFRPVSQRLPSSPMPSSTVPPNVIMPQEALFGSPRPQPLQPPQVLPRQPGMPTSVFVELPPQQGSNRPTIVKLKPGQAPPVADDSCSIQ